MPMRRRCCCRTWHEMHARIKSGSAWATINLADGLNTLGTGGAAGWPTGPGGMAILAGARSADAARVAGCAGGSYANSLVWAWTGRPGWQSYCSRRRNWLAALRGFNERDGARSGQSRQGWTPRCWRLVSHLARGNAAPGRRPGCDQCGAVGYPLGRLQPSARRALRKLCLPRAAAARPRGRRFAGVALFRTDCPWPCIDWTARNDLDGQSNPK